MSQASTNPFLEERMRTRRFFNRLSPLYPIVERHLFPEYRRVLGGIALSPELRVLDLATGTGLLAGAFSERGHAVSGLDFADKLLKRARRRFPQVDFRHFDLLHLDQFETKSYDLVCMGYFLHGLSPDFRRYVLRESARIARVQVMIFDYCCDGGWLVRLIERIEGPNYPAFIAEDRGDEFRKATLRVDREERVSEFGGFWLCTPMA
jgi:SAM-dependent methyltransferase